MKKKLLVVLLLGLISISLTGCLSMISPETNNPPVLATISDATITLGETFTYPVEATDPDEGDTLIYSLTTDPSTDMVIDENSGVINWTPTAVGNFEVNVEVSDGELSDTQSFNITVSEPLNQAPVITSVPITSVILGEIYNYTIVAIDPEEDDLTYTLITKPTGMTISIDGAIIWTPSAVGSYDVTVEVSDGELTATQSFSIVVDTVNHAPFITLIPHTIVTAGETFNYNVNANDLDGNDLTYSLTTNPSTNMSINENSGVISWPPTAIGSFDVTVEASDGELNTTQSFTIEVIAPNRVVMAELFVAPACGLCPIAKTYMAQLLEKYGFDKLVVLEEYVVNFPLSYSSGWSTSEISQRYFNGYYEYLSSDETGTPDAYFNGLNHSVHQQDSSYANYKAAIEAELTKTPKVAISASYSVTGSAVSISGQINNISSETLNNIAIEAMIYEDNVPLIVPDKPEYIVNHVVRDIITYQESGEVIDSFAPGESHEFPLTSSSLSNVQNMNNIHVVVYIQAPNSPTMEILQALYVN